VLVDCRRYFRGNDPMMKVATGPDCQPISSHSATRPILATN
jgi:hypothetical protein